MKSYFSFIVTNYTMSSEETSEYIIGRSLLNINEPLSPQKPILEFLQSVNHKNHFKDVSSDKTTDLDLSHQVENQYTPRQIHQPSPDTFLNTILPLVKRS